MPHMCVCRQVVRQLQPEYGKHVGFDFCRGTTACPAISAHSQKISSCTPQYYALTRSTPIEIAVSTDVRESCEDCLRIGSWWIHVFCASNVGQVGCCDASSTSTNALPPDTRPVISRSSRTRTRALLTNRSWSGRVRDDRRAKHGRSPSSAGASTTQRFSGSRPTSARGVHSAETLNRAVAAYMGSRASTAHTQ
jgi:hypothetical protein